MLGVLESKLVNGKIVGVRLFWPYQYLEGTVMTLMSEKAPTRPDVWLTHYGLRAVHLPNQTVGA